MTFQALSSAMKASHQEVRLQPFHPDMINVASFPVCLIVGPKRVGKSILAADLQKRFATFDQTLTVDPSQSSPTGDVIYAVEKPKDRQVSRLVVLDTDKSENDSVRVDHIYESGHRYRIALIQTLQYPDLKERRRANVDYCFVSSHFTDGAVMKKVYQHVAHVIPKFSIFEEIMSTLAATPYTFLVINNATSNNKWQDKLSYYKCYLTTPV